jgi:polyisoprenoid-binding protein YceI
MQEHSIKELTPSSLRNRDLSLVFQKRCLNIFFEKLIKPLSIFESFKNIKLKKLTMKKILTLAAAALFMQTAVFAQSTWKVDKAHSHVKFSITHLAVSDVDGVFKDFDASIVAAKPDFSDAKYTFTANTASVSTDNERRDGHLKSPDFFDVAKYPTLTFVSTSVAAAGTNKYKVTGNLTLNGVTKPVVLDAAYRGTITNPMTKGPDAGFKLTGTIKRSDFNFGSKFGSPMLSDEVELTASGEFLKQ